MSKKNVVTPKINWLCNVISPDGLHDYSVSASVPGCVHTDLLKAGIISDPFWRTEADNVQWIENCDVIYRGKFHLDSAFQKPALIFYGLDCYAEIELNGELLGKTDNMFVRHLFDAAEILKIGENILKIHFFSPVKAVEGKPPRSAAFTCERLYTRRIQCTYGWDWVARFVTMGIWRPVELIELTPDLLTDDGFGIENEGIYIYTKSLNRFGAQLCLKLDFQNISGSGTVKMEIAAPDGKTVWQKARRILAANDENRAELSEFIDIPHPELWYPAGYGEQPIYTLTCRVYNEENICTDERLQPFGIRTVELLETNDEPGSEWAELAEKIKNYEHLSHWDKNKISSRFCLLVNGVEIFCQGANWVPCEPFPSAESEDKIERLVELARAAGVNMLRVWGGGIVEKRAFYDACDRKGILVTQDFLMACGHYPEEDADFLNQLKREARASALALRNHPSLVWWSGDNENAVEGNENMPDYKGRRAALCAIGPVLQRLDPNRRFLPSSPYGGVPYASAVRGTTHNTQFLGEFFEWVRNADNNGQWHCYREYFDRYLDRFTAEQPAIGMPFVSSMRKFMEDEDIFGNDTSVSEYHTKNNPGLGEVTLYGYVDRLTKGIFGQYKDGEDRVNKMQLLHCEWIRLSMELFRRNAWYSSGILYWMWNDCWPAANGWSMVDYYAMPKPAFYSFMRCAKSVIASIVPDDGGKTKVYVSSIGAAQEVTGEMSIYKYNIVTGEESFKSSVKFSLKPDGAFSAFECEAIPLENDTVLLADVKTSLGNDRAFSLPAKRNYADMALGIGELEVIAEDELSVTVKAKKATPFAMLDRDGEIYRGFGEFMKADEIRRFEKIEI